MILSAMSISAGAASGNLLKSGDGSDGKVIDSESLTVTARVSLYIIRHSGTDCGSYYDNVSLTVS